MSENVFEPGSYRDQNNQVFYRDHQVYRALNAEAFQKWQRVSAKPFFIRLTNEGKLVRTDLSPTDPPASSFPDQPWAAVLHHETIPFISYPYEWSFGMLRDAALLTLEITTAALQDDVCMKDASAYNIQWKGIHPLLMDVASLEPWTPGDPWIGYQQFCHMFLNPLFLQAFRKVAFQPWLRGSLEGISAHDCAELLSVRDHLRRGVLTHVLLHSRLTRRFARSAKNVQKELRASGFSQEMILLNLRNLKRIIASLHWHPGRSTWSNYVHECVYDADEYETKKKFVRAVVLEKVRRQVWDLGCNRGDFSLIAAESAELVIAMDGDDVVIEKLYHDLKKRGSRNILPLVMNLANPSPNQGWRAKERKTLVERGHPDLVLCLAVVHHLSIGANIPLAEIVSWLASLQSDLVVEFVDRPDPMVQRLLRHKEDAHPDYRRDYFETLLKRHFKIDKKLFLRGDERIVYSCKVGLAGTENMS